MNSLLRYKQLLSSMALPLSIAVSDNVLLTRFYNMIYGDTRVVNVIVSVDVLKFKINNQHV